MNANTTARTHINDCKIQTMSDVCQMSSVQFCNVRKVCEVTKVV